MTMKVIILLVVLGCVSSRHFHCDSICNKHNRVKTTSTRNPTHKEEDMVPEGKVNCYGKICVVTPYNYNKFEVPQPWRKPVTGSSHKYEDFVCKDTGTASVLEVGTEFDITGVKGIDVEHGFIEVQMYVAMKWSDPELGVCVCEGGRASEGVYKLGSNLEEDIWVPDMVVWHYKEFKRENGLVRLNEMEVKVHDHCSAELRFAFDFRVKMRCSMNVDWYPYDQNICHVKLGSYSHASEDVIFREGEETSQHTFMHNSYKDYKFKVLPLCEHSKEEIVTQFGGEIAVFRVAGFSLAIARKSGRILMEYTIVLSILVMVAILSSCLPLESGRAGLVAGTSLSVIFVLVLISDYTPQGEGGMNMILMYSMWCLGFIFLSNLEYYALMAIIRWPSMLHVKLTNRTLQILDKSFFLVCFSSFILFSYIFWMKNPYLPDATACHNEIGEVEMDCSVQH